MAEQEYYIGDNGPFLYDDADVYEDGVGVVAFRATQLRVSGTPTGAYDVVRLSDLTTGALMAQEENFITEFLSL
jgi:hypothetical protein